MLGDTEFVASHIPVFLYIYFSSGLKLPPLVTDIKKYVGLLRDFGYDKLCDIGVPFFRLVWLLTGADEELTEEWLSTRSAPASKRSKAHFFDMVYALYMNDVEEALRVAKSMGPLAEQGANIFTAQRYFFHGIMSVAAYKQNGNRLHLLQTERKLKRIDQWQEKGVFNIRMFQLLLRTELLSTKPSERKAARDCYEKAIVEAAKTGFPHHLALAHEKLACYCIDVCDLDDAVDHLNQARSLYAEWGALRKVEHMTDEYAQYLGMHSVRARKGTSIHSKPHLSVLDRLFFMNL